MLILTYANISQEPKELHMQPQVQVASQFPQLNRSLLKLNVNLWPFPQQCLVVSSQQCQPLNKTCPHYQQENYFVWKFSFSAASKNFLPMQAYIDILGNQNLTQSHQYMCTDQNRVSFTIILNSCIGNELITQLLSKSKTSRMWMATQETHKQETQKHYVRKVGINYLSLTRYFPNLLYMCSHYPYLELMGIGQHQIGEEKTALKN